MKKSLWRICILTVIVLCVMVCVCGIAAADEDGNNSPFVLKLEGQDQALADGETISGNFYYRVYVEDLPEGCDSLWFGWDTTPDVTEPGEWEDEPVRLESDGDKSYIFIMPEPEAAYSSETMFVCTDKEDETTVRYIRIQYDRSSSQENAEVQITNTDPPMQYQRDYTLEWTSDAEGTEFYQVYWEMPDGQWEFYWNGSLETKLSLDHAWGNPTDQTGNYKVRVYAFGEGRLLQKSDYWTFRITPDYYDSFGVNEIYDRSKDEAVIVTLPSITDFPQTAGHTYALTLWKESAGLYTYADQKWPADGATGDAAALDPGEMVEIPLQQGETAEEGKLEDGLYILRVREYDAENAQVEQFDIYFAVIASRPTADEEGEIPTPVLMVNSKTASADNATIYAGHNSLTAAVIAPEATDGFIMIQKADMNTEPMHFYGSEGLRTYDFNEPTTVTVYGVAVYEDGSTKETTHQTLTVVKNDGGLGEFTVTAPDSKIIYTTDEENFEISISKVANSKTVLTTTNIYYNLLVYDVTNNWNRVFNGRYCGKEDAGTSGVLLGDSKTVDLTGLVQDGHTYFYVATANANGYGSAEKTGYFLVKDNPALNADAIHMTVKGKPDPVDPDTVTVPAFDTSEFTITFGEDMGLPDELDIFINGELYEFDENEWNYWERLGHAEFGQWVDDSHNMIAYAEAHWHGEQPVDDDGNPSGEAEDVFAMSNLLVINTEQIMEENSLTAPKVTMQNSVPRGDILVVTITEIDEHVDFTGASITDADRTGLWRGIYEAKTTKNAEDQETITIRIPTATLEPGTYLLEVSSDAEGYNSGKTTKVFTVRENKTNINPIITANNTEVTTQENVFLEGYAPEAEGVELLILKDPENEEQNDGRWDCGGECIDTVYAWTDSGTYYARLIAHYEDGSEKRKDLEIHVTAEGNLANPTVTIPSADPEEPEEQPVPSTIPAGQDLTLNIYAPDAEWVNVNVTDVTREWFMRFDRDVENLDEETYKGSITIPGNCFEIDRVYQIEVNSSKRGSDSGHTEIYTLAVDSNITKDDAHQVKLTVDGDDSPSQTLPSGQDVTVKVTAPGASEIKIWNGDNWEYWDDRSNWEVEWSFGRDSILVAYAYYDQEEPEEHEGEDPDGEPGEGEGGEENPGEGGEQQRIVALSNAIWLTVANRGELGKPVYETNLNDGTLEQDQWLEITIDDDDPAYTLYDEEDDPTEQIDMWYYAWLDVWVEPVDENDNGQWKKVHNDNYSWDGPEKRTIRIPTFGLAAGQYRLTVGVDAVGFQNNEKSETFELTATDKPVTVSFTIDREPGDDQEMPTIQTNDELNMYLYIAGTDGLQVQIKKKNEPNWQDERHDGGPMANWSWETGNSGIYTLTPIGYFNLDEPDEDGNWQSKVTYEDYAITVEVTAEDALDAIRLNDVPSLIFADDEDFNGIAGSFNAVEDAAGYSVELHYDYGDGRDWEDLAERKFDADQSVTSYPLNFGKDLFMAGDEIRPGIYVLKVKAWAPGYESAYLDKNIRIVERPTGTADIRVWIDGAEIDLDDENFEGAIACKAGQQVEVEISVGNGANAIRFLNDDGGWNCKDSRCLYDDNGTYLGTYRESQGYDAGTYVIYAQVSYPGENEGPIDWDNINWMNFRWDDLDWNAGSRVITLSVTADGTTATPVIEQIGDEGEVTRGKLLKAEVGIDIQETTSNVEENEEGEETNKPKIPTELHAEVLQEDGQNTGLDIQMKNLTADDYPVTIQIPTGRLEEGTYYLKVRGQAAGCNSSEAFESFTVNNPGEEDDTVILDMPEELYDNEEFSVSAYAPGASSMELHIIPTEDTEGEERVDPYPGENIDNSRMQLNAGTYEIFAKAIYEGNEEPEGNGEPEGSEEPENTENLNESAHLERTVQFRGKLEKPAIITSHVYTISEGINFTVNGLAPDMWWDISLQDMGNDEGNYENWTNVAQWNANDGIPVNNVFSVDGNELTAGHKYHIHVNVRKDGYEQNSNWTDVFVAGTSSKSLVLNVTDQEDQEITEPWPKSKNFRIKVEADTTVTAVRVINWNTGNWDYHDKEHGAEVHENGTTFIWDNLNLYEPGTYKLVAQATTQSLNGNDNFDSLEWSLTSNLVEIEIYSEGELDEPTYTITPAISEDGVATIQQGGIFVINITNENQDQHVWYNAGLKNKDGSNCGNDYAMDGVTKTIFVPTIDINPGKYDLEIRADGEGILGNSVLIPVKITEIAPDSGLTVFLAKTEVETMEEVYWSAYAPGATSITMKAWTKNANESEPDLQKWENGDWDDPTRGQGCFNFGTHSGEAYFYVTASYGEGEDPDEYGPVEITVKATKGNLRATKIHSGLWHTGEGLNLAIDPDQSSELYRIDDIWVQYVENAYQNLDATPGDNEDRRFFSYSADEVAGDLVGVRVKTAAEGYNESITEVLIRPIDAQHTLKLPDNLTTIEAEAFNGSFGIRNVIIPNGVTSIGRDAFTGTGIMTIQMPGGTTQINIEDQAFDDNITIYGYDGSYAEGYARENNISFVYIN